jgi:hypothetical protein
LIRRSIDLPSEVEESVSSGATKPTSWMGNVLAFGKKLMGKVVDGYTKPASLDPPIEKLNDLPTINPINRPSAPSEQINYLNGDSLPVRPSPTVLEMGDQWVQSTEMNGLLTWGTLLARKWTGSRPKAAKAPSYDPVIDIKWGIQSRELVDTFMDKVSDHAQACGIEKAVSHALENPKLYTQAIETVRKKLATGQIDRIAVALFEQVVQQNISKVASKSTPDQANQLLASVREDLPKIQQQFLQQEASLEAQSSEEVLANTTSKADINLLKQAMCSMQPIDQLAGTTSLMGNTYNMKDILVQNNLDHGNRYTKCAGL